MDAALDRSPLVAVMTYDPGRSATNPPSGSTDAPAAPTDQRMAGAVTAPPPLVVAFTVKCTTSPVRAVVVRGSTSSEATGFLITVTGTSAFAPPDCTRIRARPGATPLTSPAGSTVAIAGADDVQANVTSSRGIPTLDRAVAFTATPAPTTSDCAGATTSILATDSGLTRI